MLQRRGPLEALLARLDTVDRLVLLGDIVELFGVSPRTAIDTAAPILREIGARLGGDRQVVLVPGNHDRPLVRNWIRERGSGLEPDAVVPATASPLLEQVVSLLGPASVEVRYPSVWLADRVWATHGHYIDRHLMPISAWGVLRGGRRAAALAPASPFDYERSGRVHLSPAMRWLPRPLAAAVEDVADVARAATMPRLERHILRRSIAPMTSRVLGVQVWRHSLPALARVADQLGVEADTIVFGHVHRAGPLERDDPRRWRGSDGRPVFLNTGSWLYEPLLVHRARPPHPYWPGGAVVLDDSGPRAVGLLDGLDASQLR